MATKSPQLPDAAPPVSKSTLPLPLVNEKDKCLTCTVCLDNFKEPKVLRCCHTFCKSCLERILEKAKVKTNLVCPQCRAEHTVPPNGPEGFLTDFSLLSELSKSLTSESDVESPRSVDVCGECDSSDVAVAFCCVCRSYLCSACSGIHTKLKHFRNHKVTSLECLGQEVVSEDETITLYCREHLEPLKVFCKTCQLLVCCQCIAESHAEGHKFGPINEATRREVQITLEALAEKARQSLTEFEENLKYIKEVEALAVNRPAGLQTTINETFDSLVAALEARRAQLLKQAEGKCNEDLKEVWAQKDYVETVVIGLSSTLAFVDRAVQCCRDVELLSLCSQTISRLKELEEHKWDPSTVETVDCMQQRFIGGDHTAYPASVGEIVERVNISRVTEKSNVCRIDISLENISTGMLVNETRELTLKVFAVPIVSASTAPVRHISVDVDPSDVEARTVDEKLLVHKKNGDGVISFTPTRSGQHRISVCLKNAQLKTSEFFIQVRLSSHYPTSAPRIHHGFPAVARPKPWPRTVARFGV